jgi:hypothetical protein
VRLKVDRDSMQPTPHDGYQSLGGREPLGADEFNATAFEFLLHSGVAENPPPRDFPFQTVVEQHPRLKGANFSMPVSNMIGYAYSRDRRPAKEYGEPERLKEAYSKAHEYLFSLAVSQLLVNDTNADFNATGQVTVTQAAITVSRPFSVAVEALLLLIAVMTASLAWFCRKAPSNLRSNPSSLSRLADSFRTNPTLVTRFSRFDSYDAAALRRALRNVRFELTEKSVLKASGIVTSKDPEGIRLGEADVIAKTSESERYYEPVRPWALRTEFGIFFMVILAAGIVVLSYFKHLEVSNKGELPETRLIYLILVLLTIMV